MLQAVDRLGKPLLPVWHSGPFPPELLAVEMGALQYQRVDGENFEIGATNLIEQLRKLNHEINDQNGAISENEATEEVVDAHRANRYTTSSLRNTTIKAPTELNQTIEGDLWPNDLTTLINIRYSRVKEVISGRSRSSHKTCL